MFLCANYFRACYQYLNISACRFLKGSDVKHLCSLNSPVSVDLHVYSISEEIIEYPNVVKNQYKYDFSPYVNVHIYVSSFGFQYFSYHLLLEEGVRKFSSTFPQSMPSQKK